METFETYRPYLFSFAYRMLGTAMDAEDMVQETYLRYQKSAPEAIHSLKAYLTTILTRLCMDQLQLARRKREVYVGPWLPEPILTQEAAVDSDAGDPEKRVEAEESVSLAFLVLLEQLQPFERAVFLLREVFDYEFSEIAGVLGKSEAACRRSFSRAKQHLRDHRPRFTASPETHQRLLEEYIRAVETGEMATLMGLLSEDVTLWADAGGRIKAAVLRPIRGREAVARLSLASKRFWPEHYRVEIEDVNGKAALVVRTGDQVFTLLSIDVSGGHIQTIRLILNPEKLTRV
ncbi:MAG: RNA polymerase sigma-70 factor [Nitrososphaerota archaeon]